MSKVFRYGITSALSVLSIVLSIGCYESPFALGPESEARTDVGYLGDWQVESQNKENQPRIVIRNIDHKSYYVEMDQPGEKPMRMVGFVLKVKGVPFAHLRELKTDGTIPETYIITRIEMKNGKLSIRQLNEKFFKERKIESSDDLRKLVEANLNNEEMYDKESAFTAAKLES